MIFPPLHVSFSSNNCKLLQTKYHFVATSDQNTIELAIKALMYAVGTPIAGSESRQTCVDIRPKTSSDNDYIRFVYGGGCSANVSNHCLMIN
jgi:hypothetical protein